MTSENILLQCNFRKCRYPYLVEDGVEYYRMIHEDAGRVVVFRQTPVSYPNYEFVGFDTFLSSKLEEEVEGDNFPVI